MAIAALTMCVGNVYILHFFLPRMIRIRYVTSQHVTHYFATAKVLIQHNASPYLTLALTFSLIQMLIISIVKDLVQSVLNDKRTLLSNS